MRLRLSAGECIMVFEYLKYGKSSVSLLAMTLLILVLGKIPMSRRQKNIRLDGLRVFLPCETSTFNDDALVEDSPKDKRLEKPFRFPRNAPQRLLAMGSLTIMLVVFLPCSLMAQRGKTEGGPPPALVEVTTVIEKEVLTRINLIGTAEPWLETVVASEEAGKVQSMLFDEGEKVKKNQRLCEQDTSQLNLKIEAAKSDLAEAEILYAQAKREWERQKRLFAINSVSEKAYEDAKFKLDASQEKVARLRTELLLLKDQLDKRRIKSPVSGYVVERHCLVGQWLGEGEPVATLVVSDPIRVRVPVPERYVRHLKKGNPAEVTFDALPGRTFEGKIFSIIPRADEAARTFPVRIEIPNPDAAIKAGMLGRATLPVGNPHNAILVPKDALVLDGTGAAVYVIINQSARLVPVKTGSAHGALIEVEGDLKAGLKVVVRGNERLRPGQPVQIAPDMKSRKTSTIKDERHAQTLTPPPLAAYENC
jgi:RND family efflux transporter MFP subunit